MINSPAIPTPAQAEAGNYRKHHVRIQGMDVTIETPKGRSRKPGWPKMACHYGYIKRTLGADGDHVDVMIGPHVDSELVVVVDQVSQAGRFDEHKCLIGFRDTQTAIDTYRKCYSRGWRVGPVTTMTIGQFKSWLADGDQTKMVSKQVSKYAAEEAVGNHGDRGRFVTTEDGNQIFITSKGTINRTGQPIGGSTTPGSEPPKTNRPVSIPKKTMQHPGGGIGIDLDGRLPLQQQVREKPNYAERLKALAKRRGESLENVGKQAPATQNEKPLVNPPGNLERRSPAVREFNNSIMDRIRAYEQQTGDDVNQPAAESHPLHHSNLSASIQNALLNWHSQAHQVTKPIEIAAQGASWQTKDPNVIRAIKSSQYDQQKAKIDEQATMLNSLIDHFRQ